METTGNAEIRDDDGGNGIGGGEGDAVVRRRTCSPQKIFIALFLCGFVLFLVIDAFNEKYVATILDTFLDWMKDNIVAGSFAFFFVYIICTVLFVPGSALTIGAGYIYSETIGTGGLGILCGSLVVWVAATAGASLAFLLGRYVFKESAQKIFRKYTVMSAVDRVMAERGLKMMLLLRLSPLIPFNVLNYALSSTTVSFVHYEIGMVAMIPATVAFVYIGSTVSDIGSTSGSDDSDIVKIVLYVLGGIASIAVVVAVSYYARKEIKLTINNTAGEVHPGTQGALALTSRDEETAGRE